MSWDLRSAIRRWGATILGEFVGRRVGIIGVLVAAVLVTGAALNVAHADIDLDATNDSAVQTRKLQTELMVSALYCGQQARYNAFVRRFESELVVSGQKLKALFVSRHGARQAVPKLDTYLTRLANEESQRRLTLGNRYCQDAKALFTEVLLLGQAELIAFASSRASTPLPFGRVTLLQNRLN